MTNVLPRLLHDLEPARGLIKADYEDFVVEEIPLYPADGRGTHTYFLLEKTGLSTRQAISDIARVLNVRRRAIGFAGMKDARAVARQWLSVEHVDPAIVEALDIPRLRVLKVTRHTNKLRLGHLKANRFLIKVRQTEPDRLAELQDALAMLMRRGVPNYFGEQRFGGRGDTWAVGQAIVRGNPEVARDLVIGRPSPADFGRVRRARELYEQREYEKAARLWPNMFHDERRALRALIHSPGRKRRAFSAIDVSTRNFYVSAYQSYLFNHVVAARLTEGLEHLWDGDLAWIHTSGAVFSVQDAAAEQNRADRFEISPSGPLFGYRMSKPNGRAGELEAAITAEEGLSERLFQAGRLRVKGARRPLRFQPDDPHIQLGADGRGAYLELSFLLPRGCYATALLRELFNEQPSKTAVDIGGAEVPSA